MEEPIMAEENEEVETEETEESGVVKTLRERGDAAETKLAVAERKMAFMEAGLDLSNPVAAFFAEKYDGELTAEAVLAEAAKLDLVEAPPDPAVTEQQQEQQDTREALAGGIPTEGEAPSQDPRVEGLEAYHDARMRGIPIDPAASQFFDRVIDAAAKGDQRVLYDPDEWREQFRDMGYR